MAWFDEFNLPGATITGHFAFVREDGPDVDDAPDLQLASGKVRFEPTAKAVRANGAWVGISPVTAQIFEGEIIVSEEDPRPLRLLSTDADTGVDNWGWRATFDIDGANIKPIPFHAPTTGVHLTGDDLIPITGLPVEVIAQGGLDRLAALESTVTAHTAALDARARITRGILGGGTDFDSMHTLEWAGVWALSASATYPNAPAPALQGTVEVVFGRERYGVAQRVVSEGRLFWRELIDSTLTVGRWSPWNEGASVAQIEPVTASTGWQKLPTLGAVSGDMWMKRTGPWIELAARSLAPGGVGVVDLVSIPTGFRPDNGAAAVRLGAIFTDAGTAGVCSYFDGRIRMINASGTNSYGGRVSWSTTDAWPITLPGSPA